MLFPKDGNNGLETAAGSNPRSIFFILKIYRATYYARFMRAFFLFAAKKIVRLNRFTAFLFLPAYDLSWKTENASKRI